MQLAIFLSSMIQTNLHELINAENKKINEILSPFARILRANLYNGLHRIYYGYKSNQQT